jgi:hypothetical protein
VGKHLNEVVGPLFMRVAAQQEEPQSDSILGKRARARDGAIGIVVQCSAAGWVQLEDAQGRRGKKYRMGDVEDVGEGEEEAEQEQQEEEEGEHGREEQEEEAAQEEPIDATHAQRLAVQEGLTLQRSGRAASGYQGVAFEQRNPNKPWRAILRGHSLGYYGSPEAAALAYARAVKVKGKEAEAEAGEEEEQEAEAEVEEEETAEADVKVAVEDDMDECFVQWNVHEQLAHIARWPAWRSDESGDTLLHLAAWAGSSEEVVRACIEAGLVSVPNSDGEVPLHLAAKQGRMAAVQQLLQARRDTALAVDNFGDMPLHNVGGEPFPAHCG